MGAARLYKTGTPYNGQDLLELDFTQSADVVYFAHLYYPPQKLVRLDHTEWEVSEIAFGPTIDAPTGLAVTATHPNEDTTLSDGSANQNPQYYPLEKTYAVASVNAAGQESRLSATDSATNDLSLKGNYNSLAWDADPDAVYYNIYGQGNGSLSMGYIGRAETNAFLDNDGGVDPDYADGPRIGNNPFAGDGNYPSTVTFHQQRLGWGRTVAKPNGIWISFAADFENMDRSRPGKPDDAFNFALVSERVNAVNQLASMGDLLALTSDGIFSVAGEDQVLTATAPRTKRELGVGASRLDPLIIDETLLFRPSQGSSVRALGFSFEIEGLRSNNLAIFSPHFFNGFEIIAWDYQREPFSAVWAVRSDGKLLCMTWEPEQQVFGWSICETDGQVEAVAVITEQGMDRVYLAVRRTLAGEENVFIERMALPLLVPEDLADACYLDCAITQKTDEPTDTITGLWHLEGETVTAFADGYVMENLTVENGQLQLPLVGEERMEASTITVGLPYQGEIETMPLTLGGKTVDWQTIEKVNIRVKDTRGIKAGPGGGEVVEIKQRETELLDEPIALKTGDFPLNMSAKWSTGATARVRQEYPLPATINALFLTPRVTK